MARKDDKQMMVALDIGTSKVVAIVGEIDLDGQLEIVGLGTHPARGLKKGVVVNIESTVQSIQRAAEEAEQMAGCRIHSVYAGISGSHIRGRNSQGMTPIRTGEVTADDVARVLESARAVAIPADQKILHSIPQEYLIDQQEGIREPIGMSGVRLEANVHLVTGAVNAAQNVIKCVHRCGYEVDDIILQQLASAEAVLTDDERDLGVCLVDVGGGTTDIAVFTQGSISYSAVIPIGGDQVTNDIAVALRTPTQHAEQIKIQHACCLRQLVDADELVEVPSITGRAPQRLARQNLAEVVQNRYEELFELVQDQLQRSGFESLIGAGVVLTGGSSRMEGVVELAEEVFHMPVRLGSPTRVTGLNGLIDNPIYSTAVGLLLFGYRYQSFKQIIDAQTHSYGFVERLKRWFKVNF